MPANHKTPPCRSLDIYRLVVARGLKQLDVADSFRVTPARISQVVRRVRKWVDQAIGDWLFPGRDDLRFYVALQSERIRVHELDTEPETVQFAGPGWSYARRHATGANHSPNTGANISAQPINSPINLPSAADSDCLAATPCSQTDLLPPEIDELGRRVAQMLLLWKKSRKLSAAFRTPSF